MAGEIYPGDVWIESGWLNPRRILFVISVIEQPYTSLLKRMVVLSVSRDGNKIITSLINSNSWHIDNALIIRNEK